MALPAQTVQANATNATTVVLSWTAVTGAQRYYVQRAIGSASFSNLSTPTITGTGYTDTGVPANVLVQYRLMTKLGNGNFRYSAAVQRKLSGSTGRERRWRRAVGQPLQAGGAASQSGGSAGGAASQSGGTTSTGGTARGGPPPRWRSLPIRGLSSRGRWRSSSRRWLSFPGRWRSVTCGGRTGPGWRGTR